MKYTYESTEAETIAQLAMLERLFDKTLGMIATFAADRPAPAAPSAPDEKPIPDAAFWHPSTAPTPADDLPLPSNKVREEQTVAPYTAPTTSYPPDVEGTGKALFTDLVLRWVENIGIEGAEQPPRGDMMRDFANSRYSFRALGFIQSKGGLTRACEFVLNEHYMSDARYDLELQKIVVLAATTLCQVGSVFFHELSDLYEHRDIYKEKK